MKESDTIEQEETFGDEAPFAEDASVVEPKKSTRKKNSRPAWKRMLSYRWIMRNIPYFLFLAVLAVVYIYNGHYADKTIRHMTRVNRELKELQYEYKTMKSEVMFRSKQSELAKAVAPFGLKELLQPPLIIGDSIAANKP
ncbi:FtsL-like putative cell division protein [Flavitalea sp.]|nr:FtsL-like putative cell division protein [Flavitalea sp.]